MWRRAGERLAVLIDTGLLIDWERTESAEALETLVGAEERAISVVTVSELLHGVHRASRAARTRRRAFVEHVLAGLEALPITETVARVHAEVWADLTRRRQTIGAHDLWIGATALALGFGVATGDRAEFSHIRGLRVLAPS
ncbi:MAG TPA: PIN domain-containing protein [Gaiellaceae bacterium]|nr:PIN domain-containing protein [Gaiellaceae bacterium]